MLQSFLNDRLADWSDERIPDSFKVRVWHDSTDPATLSNDFEFNAAVTKLKLLGTAYAKDFNLGNQMPQPDRNNYVVQAAVGIATEMHEQYESLDDNPPMTPISYLIQEDVFGELREKLAAVPSVTKTEAAGMQAIPLVLTMHCTTEPKVLKKYKGRVNEGHKMVSEHDLGGKKRKAGVIDVGPELKKLKTN